MDPRLLLLLDSRSPAGAHSHSGGMEPAVMAGWVHDVEDVREFCRGRLRTSGRVAAAFAAAACKLAGDHGTRFASERESVPKINGEPAHWRELDDEFSARTASEATRLASRTLGSGLRRLVRSTFPATDLGAPWSLIDGAPHHPLVLGAGVALGGGSPVLAARAAALGVCTSAASAAVRLLGLDPFAVHALLAALSPAIEALVADVVELPELPADSAPVIELLADVHTTQEVRLFAS